ncbi:uncharacterized protein LOC128390970 [Panonychus citri]|uniref:uncharacterized protein LOC128390544 n=1 Tax=Panonychus citri TaxID=50023 RepID=UPI0023071C98|nr:uncharacterized protein LOC128390544 [Panonychus citri]XP_053206763.1 uncharacterized protein LOC128390970 [Panonychus citri]
MGSLSSTISSPSSATINFKRVNCVCCFNLIALLVILFAISNEGLVESSRCRLGICQRSELPCRRCRFREPLRFGKRANLLPKQNSDQVNGDQLISNQVNHENEKQLIQPIKDFISWRNLISPTASSLPNDDLISTTTTTTSYYPSSSSSSSSFNRNPNQNKSKQSTSLFLNYLLADMINPNQPIPTSLIEKLKEKNLISYNYSYDNDNTV